MHESWNKFFINNTKLINNIKSKIDWSKTVYPTSENIFRVFNMDISKIDIIIVGQDPYHQKEQANGLAFSVQKYIKLPPSLKNIFKAIKLQKNIDRKNGDLSDWEEQGIFLLNRSLSVYDSEPNSHSNFGWSLFSENVIKYININRTNVVYMLWGASAIDLKKNIDEKNNLILKSVHPSPLSAYRGFFTNNHFIEAEQYLAKKINW